MKITKKETAIRYLCVFNKEDIARLKTIGMLPPYVDTAELWLTSDEIEIAGFSLPKEESRKVVCPVCDHVFSEDYLKETTIPKEGDISLCIRCGNVSTFNENTELVEMDVTSLPKNVQEALRKAQLAIEATKVSGTTTTVKVSN